MNKKNEDLISIIIPVYNVEDYLERCINSIINQTYKNLEIIIVDDGSTDNSGKICDMYKEKDSRIKVFHKKNGGLSDARNYGMKYAYGKYIAFCDSDDFVDKKMYEILYNNLIENNADISITNYYKFSSSEEITDNYDYKKNDKITVYDKIGMFDHLFDDYLLSMVAWNKLYKKELLENLQYPKGKLVEDVALAHYIYSRCNKIVITNLQLYFYYQRETSILGSVKVGLLDELDFVYDRIEFMKKEKLTQTKSFQQTKTYFIDKYISLYFELILNNKKIDKNTLEHYDKMVKKIYKDSKKLSIKKKIKYNIFLFNKDLYVWAKKTKSKINNIKEKIFIKKSSNQLDHEYKKYLDYVEKQNKKKYIIFNVPNHGNLGDHAIWIAENKMLEDNDIKPFAVMSQNTKYFIEKYSGNIDKDDVIMITGGGNLGTIWEHEQIRVNEVLKEFKENKILIFPQTIFYSSDRHAMYALERDKKIYSQCKDLIICNRNKESYNFCVDNFKKNKILLCPDVVLYLNNFIKCSSNYKRTGIGICFRNDKEKTNSEHIKAKVLEDVSKKLKDDKKYYFSTVTTTEPKYNYKKGMHDLSTLLKFVLRRRLIITDRLHAMIFATITNTPCIAFDNKSGKVKGVYEWIEKENDYVLFIEEYNKDKLEIFLNSLNNKFNYKNSKIKKELNNVIEQIK